MKEKKDFALVPRPASAVEKIQPGSKRILSGMIADTLALIQREPPRPLRIVIVESEKGLFQSYALVIKSIFKNFRLSWFEDGQAAWQELSETDPDLLIRPHRE